MSRPSEEDHQRLLAVHDQIPPVPTARSISRRFIVGLIPLYSFFLLGSGVWIGRYLTLHPNITCLEYSQKWSPIMEELDNSYHTVQFNGSLFKENTFRLPAGPEVDKAWDSLGINYRALALPKSQAARSGLSPGQVQINPAYGGGFPTNVEGLHHLHCLNLVRQSLYYNIEYYRAQKKGAFVNDENVIRHHISHCLDIIRQQLICTPNTSLLGQVWWDPKAPKAFVDFNTEHECKNFEAIRSWAEKKQISEHVPKDFLLPPRSKKDVYEEIP
ncbi:BgTH12-02374 [Blumeria graminis f. sp. triticale]|uniref:Bgt-5287 n=3 Tax=Blumeria graminis TaxID=34373 RepID=A0A061HKK8_BLUGR|nr:hypothetical protein BGT96224_5287 [Blumeria graminis f. sp. tritici 96224]CAD6502133.1 BgTH12-02374 [Blumeria graminis f. sp. triticale]VDB86149.1 Bgt-5287 [Blumeria graminis f. sp. tritici]